MATYTPNYNLIKPDYEEPADVAQLNNNADLIDAALAGKQNTLTFDTTPTSGSTNPVTSGGLYTEAGNLAAGMAILANNNTHAAIASGQYVYVRGHGSLSEGLYRATANIAANGTLSTSNLTAVSGGGLNAVIGSFGDIVSISSGSVSVATDTSVEVASVTLTPGRWLVIGSIDWQANETGFRQASFGNGVNPGRAYTSTTQGIAGKEAYQQVVHIVSTAESTTSALFARQNSGTTLNAYPAIYAIKIVTVW